MEACVVVAVVCIAHETDWLCPRLFGYAKIIFSTNAATIHYHWPDKQANKPSFVLCWAGRAFRRKRHRKNDTSVRHGSQMDPDHLTPPYQQAATPWTAWS